MKVLCILILTSISIFSQEQKGLSKTQSEEILNSHNELRKKTSASIPDLVWSEEIASYAQEWANHLSKTKNCGLEHRKGANRVKRYGENLFAMYGASADGKKVTEDWYSEIADYTYSSNSCKSGKVCGHYTQVIWAKSTELGCGMAKCKRGEVWVCNYNPPGNFVGQKPY